VTTWGKLEKVNSANVANINTLKVSGGSLKKWALISVDNKWSLSEGESAILHLSNTLSGSLGASDTAQILLSTKIVERGDKSLSVFTVEAVNNERKFRDRIDSVSSSLDKRSASGSGESRGTSVSLLIEVDLSLPLSPDLEWGKQATLAAHVTESTLAGPMGTRT